MSVREADACEREESGRHNAGPAAIARRQMTASGVARVGGGNAASIA